MTVLASGVMIEGDGPLGLAGLSVPLVGAVEATGNPFEPFRLVDSAGEPVLPLMVFLADLQACGRAAAVVFDGAVVVVPVSVGRWGAAGSGDARRGASFVRWVQVAGKPARRHWRDDDDAAGVRPGIPVPNRVTGKSPTGPQYATATVAHGKTVVRTFYDFHLRPARLPGQGPGPGSSLRPPARSCLVPGSK